MKEGLHVFEIFRELIGCCLERRPRLTEITRTRRNIQTVSSISCSETNTAFSFSTMSICDFLRKYGRLPAVQCNFVRDLATSYGVTLAHCLCLLLQAYSRPPFNARATGCPREPYVDTVLLRFREEGTPNFDPDSGKLYMLSVLMDVGSDNTVQRVGTGSDPRILVVISKDNSFHADTMNESQTGYIYSPSKQKIRRRVCSGVV